MIRKWIKRRKKTEPDVTLPEPPKPPQQRAPEIRIQEFTVSVEASQPKYDARYPQALINVDGGRLHIEFVDAGFSSTDIPRLIDGLQLAQQKADELWPRYIVT